MWSSTNKMTSVIGQGAGQLRGLALLVTWLLVEVTLAPSKVQGLPAGHSDPKNNTRHKLLCLMLDGFRWDYVEQQPENLPGFGRILAEGVQANWSNPAFPTLSYPMWTTLSTGLYSETHNIVGNHFYDPKDKDSFSLDDPPSTVKEKWWTKEPVWITSTRAGINTGAIYWSQCSVPWDGITPRHCEPYDPKDNHISFRTNLKKAVDLLDHDFGLVMVYLESVDLVGHNWGPDSAQLREEVQSADSDIEFLLDQLDERGLTNETNIIIVSDHGMISTDPGHTVSYNIDDYLDTDLVENIGDRGPLMNIKVPPENVEKVFEQLSAIPEGVRVYRHDEIPDRYHVRKSEYAHEILVVAEKGYLLNPSKDLSKQVPPIPDYKVSGAHGYDPEEMDMKGIFFARGPDFIEDTVIPPIDMVDVYQLVCHLLDLNALPNNGTWGHVLSALVRKDGVTAGTCPSAGSSTQVILFGLFLIMAVKRGIEG